MIYRGKGPKSSCSHPVCLRWVGKHFQCANLTSVFQPLHFQAIWDKHRFGSPVFLCKCWIFPLVSAASGAKTVLSLESSRVGVFTQTRGRRNKWQQRRGRLKAVPFPFAIILKNTWRYSLGLYHSLMFLWRKEFQIHEHRLCQCCWYFGQVNDLIVFVYILGKSLFIFWKEQTSLQMDPANLSPFYFLV